MADEIYQCKTSCLSALDLLLTSYQGWIIARRKDNSWVNAYHLLNVTGYKEYNLSSKHEVFKKLRKTRFEEYVSIPRGCALARGTWIPLHAAVELAKEKFIYDGSLKRLLEYVPSADKELPEIPKGLYNLNILQVMNAENTNAVSRKEKELRERVRCMMDSSALTPEEISSFLGGREKKRDDSSTTEPEGTRSVTPCGQAQAEAGLSQEVEPVLSPCRFSKRIKEKYSVGSEEKPKSCLSLPQRRETPKKPSPSRKRPSDSAVESPSKKHEISPKRTKPPPPSTKTFLEGDFDCVTVLKLLIAAKVEWTDLWSGGKTADHNEAYETVLKLIIHDSLEDAHFKTSELAIILNYPPKMFDGKVGEQKDLTLYLLKALLLIAKDFEPLTEKERIGFETTTKTILKKCLDYPDFSVEELGEVALSIEQAFW